MISSVRPGSEAARLKLKPGDKIDQLSVANTDRPSAFLFAIPADPAAGGPCVVAAQASRCTTGAGGTLMLLLRLGDKLANFWKRFPIPT